MPKTLRARPAADTAEEKTIRKLAEPASAVSAADQGDTVLT